MLHFLLLVVLHFSSVTVAFQINRIEPEASPINTNSSAILFGEDLNDITVILESIPKDENETKITKQIIPTQTSFSEAHIQIPSFTSPTYAIIRILKNGSPSHFPIFFQFYKQPSFFCCDPQTASFAGTEKITISGSNFFPSDHIQVKLKTSWTEKYAPAQFVNESILTFNAPPTSYTEDQDHSVEVHVAMDGINYVPTSNPDSSFKYELSELLQVAFLYVGPIEDLGWTFSQNNGRKEIEMLYPGVVTTEYVEIVTLATIRQNILKFCERNFDLVITGSDLFLADSRIVSKNPVCKDTHIVSSTGEEPDENLSVVWGRIFQAKYLAGMTAGYMMGPGKTPRSSTCVGYIGGPNNAEVYRGFNAFALGCQRANPNCTVKAVFLMTWHAPDLERDAAKYMWHVQGCDIIAQETDSDKPSRYFAEMNGYSIGYNSDMSGIVGNSVLISPYVVWGKLYSYFIDTIIKTGKDSLRPGVNIFHGLDEGSVHLWPFANSVPSPIRTKVLDVWKKIENKELDVFCGELIMVENDEQTRIVPGSEMNNSQKITCLNDTMLYSMHYRLKGVEFVKPGISTYGAVNLLPPRNEPVFYMPEYEWELPIWVGIIFMLIALIGLIAVIFTFRFMYHHRENIWFKSHSVRLMWFILISCFLMFSLPFILFVAFVEPSTYSCGATRFVTHLSIYLCVPPICLKTYRLHKFFSAARHLRTSRCSDKQLLSYCFGSLLFFSVYIAIWFTYRPPTPQRFELSEIDKYVILCHSIDIYDAFISIPELLSFLWATQLVFLIHGIPKRFNESKYIGYTLYTVVVIIGILLSLTLIVGEEEPLASYVLTNIGILVIAWVTFASLFGVKINKIVKKAKLDKTKATYDKGTRAIPMEDLSQKSTTSIRSVRESANRNI